MTIHEFRRPHPDAPITRYLPLERFRSLITASRLFFPTHETLLACDTMEGKWPPAYREASNNAERIRISFPPLTRQEHDERGRAMELGVEEMKRRYVVSCWTVNPDETVEMWNSRQVAIRSTCVRFLESLVDELPSYWGMVEYINYEPGERQWPVPYLSLFHKYKPIWDFEQEVRFVITRPGPEKVGWSNGVRLPILIDSVHLCPGAGPDLEAEVRSLLNRRRLSDVAVVASCLK